MGVPVTIPLDAVPVVDTLLTFKTVLVPMIRRRFGEDVYASWFGGMQIDRLVGDEARLSVRTKFLKRWIDDHYFDPLKLLVVEAFPEARRLVIGVREGAPKSRPELIVVAPAPSPVSTPEPAKKAGSKDERLAEAIDPLVSSPLDHRMVFDAFQVGRSNELAFASAKGIGTAAFGDPLIFNPLYIHGGVGLGKSHLLHAIAHAAIERERRVLYMTAEKFMFGFAQAMKSLTLNEYKRRLRDVEVLIIDDAQFLQGKTIQQEFCHAVNALIETRKQVIVAADRPPHDLESLDERIRSRLAGGLCVEVGSLDLELRVKMLDARIAASRKLMPNFDVSPAVVLRVASLIKTNGRDLDGAVNRLMATFSLKKVSLSVEAAEAAVGDLVRLREPRKVKIEEIQNLVAQQYQVSRGDILSARRTANVVLPRQIAMYLSKLITLRSLPEIGRKFGGRDHTTILHAVRKIEGLIAREPELGRELQNLQAMLEDR